MYWKATLLSCHFFPIWFIRCKSYQILLAHIDKLIIKFIWKCKGCSIVQTLLKKENKFGWLILPGIKVCSKATVIKTVGYWHKNRHKYKDIKIKLYNFSLLLPPFFPPSLSQLRFPNSKCILISSVDLNALKKVLLYLSIKFCPKISKF